MRALLGQGLVLRLVPRANEYRLPRFFIVAEEIDDLFSTVERNGIHIHQEVAEAASRSASEIAEPTAFDQGEGRAEPDPDLTAGPLDKATIRVPVHMMEMINKQARTSRQLVQELGREPTSEEIAKRMDLSVDAVCKAKKVAQQPVSFEAPIGADEEVRLGDLVEDKNVVLPLDAAIELDLKERMASMLTTLTPREERIIKMRFGFDNGSEHTLEEVGQIFALTRERIRQIEAKALRKLRHPSRSSKFLVVLESSC